ncbi:MAG: hypothetical protein A2Z21_06110 [Candidatus Fraserbacteria bacterium RBG_16_55_9]|uniref:HYR domain-containing protein n=1 Tax=Fraserbacteria sp. (strain RBG_16_55_9) TaxID=1817864 RepID=A0A1F5V2G6_FRAXR|nr:MAG: hypothetical protein A2Z21_06110 [Candidatus Fraserbacteria bacterium RBG_16_55_9]
MTFLRKAASGGQQTQKVEQTQSKIDLVLNKGDELLMAPCRGVLSLVLGILLLLGIGVGTIERVDALPPSCTPVESAPPKIHIVTPRNGDIYVLHQPVLASWTVADPAPSSGLEAVAATAPDDSPLDTNKTGYKTFTVSAVDNCDNAASEVVHYWVVYRAQAQEPLPQTAFGEGSSPQLEALTGQLIPFSFSITDFLGTVVPNAVGTLSVIDPQTREIVSIDQGIIGVFRYDAGANLYRYSLDTSTLAVGNYEIFVQFNDARTLYRILLKLNA